MKQYNCYWENDIDRISSLQWNKLFNFEALKSHAFFSSLHHSLFPNVKFTYFVIKEGMDMVAIVPCFTCLMDIDVLANKYIKKPVSYIRNFYKNFMRVSVFGVGSYAATCEQHVGVQKGLSADKLATIHTIINGEVKKKSVELGCEIVIIKEIPQHELSLISSIFDADFYFYDSLPNSYVPVSSKYPYPAGLKRNERKRYKKAKAEFDKRYKWDLITDFGDYDKEIEKLYLNVLEKSSNQFERMNANFFSNINKFLNEDTFVLAARDKDEKINVFEIVIVDTNKLVPIYIGIDYSGNTDVKTLYFNTIFRVIEEAQKMDKKFVVLGQTSYYPKVLSGALVERLYAGFYSHNCFIRLLIKYLFKYLFKPTKVIDNIYTDAAQKDIVSSFVRDGYVIYNINKSNEN